MTVEFTLAGQSFTALNGGPLFQFSPAISFQVFCHTQEEIDHYWEQLSAGGQTQKCGWLADPFGVTWQIVPHAWNEMAKHPDREKFARAMNAMLTMEKLDIAALSAAFDG